ncbi:heterokaryon incompatibility protein-domain-containing protein [Collybia nuda]|uniref:Heterokaryon incompatibility protein-domain-containing protein n=1 Tax=Collybia nuda TaxID=64659 RepID=A0A9P6CNJ3_9AGAR|nr:heterokaryon incompatibility protein-domain-containing protein [Collybia nuda]
MSCQANPTRDGNAQALIHCTLGHTPLDSSNSKPIYTALSYVWGDSTHTRPIIVDDTMVQITTNLETALQHLQYDIGNMPVWVYFICINQADIEEKSRQVQMMREIYENATRTIIWLGPAEDGSDELIDYLESFGREAHENRIFDLELFDQRNWTWDDDGGENLILPNDAVKELVSRAFLVFTQDRGLKQFTTRPWWHRAWVKQEFQDAFKVLGGIRRFRQAVEESAVRIHAADSQYKIYSLLGLAANAGELGITADYSKSCQEVYTDIAKVLLKNGDLNILTMCRPPGDISDLPTWVPDWTAPILIPWMSMPKDKNFSASANLRHSFVPCAQHDSVTLECVRVDTILEYGHTHIGDPPTLKKGQNVESLQEALIGVENFVRRSNAISKEDHADAAWRIHIVDQEFAPSSLQDRRRATANSKSQYKELRRVLGIPVYGESHLSRFDAVQGYGAYLVRMGDTHNSRLFLSDMGYVGLVPVNAEVGDLICILFGASVPLVLRRKIDGRYQLIGEAYVYGIMDGEFLKKENVVSEDFVLQ